MYLHYVLLYTRTHLITVLDSDDADDDNDDDDDDDDDTAEDQHYQAT